MTYWQIQYRTWYKWAKRFTALFTQDAFKALHTLIFIPNLVCLCSTFKNDTRNKSILLITVSNPKVNHPNLRSCQCIIFWKKYSEVTACSLLHTGYGAMLSEGRVPEQVLQWIPTAGSLLCSGRMLFHRGARVVTTSLFSVIDKLLNLHIALCCQTREKIEGKKERHEFIGSLMKSWTYE